jgi:hypothetical protein
MNANDIVDISQIEKDQNDRIFQTLDIYIKLMSQLDNSFPYNWTFDRIFINSKYPLIQQLHKVYDLLTPEVISILLENFMQSHMDIKEILNFFFIINQSLLHFDFYSKNPDYVTKYEYSLIQKYYETMSADFSYCIEFYKTEPGNDALFNYANNNERRRKVYMDDSCNILFIFSPF